jgi:flagellar biosynthesis/type III secretory pathway M-ring protein FliF/YscJ
MNNNPIQALLGILNKLNPKQKFMLGGGILVTLALLTALLFLMNEPTYTSLYSGLSQEDASKVIEYLGTQKIIYSSA